MPDIRVICITTNNFRLHTRRLVCSLLRYHPSAQVTVYAESPISDSVFERPGVEVVVLPEILTLGVKRAKFAAYAHAAQSGGFVYLDSDIIVLAPLVDLDGVSAFTACRDDLSECPFIDNPTRPWPGAPALSGDAYVNSGVFAVPDSLRGFVDEIALEARSDKQWARYVIPGKLHDNHFLCAMLAKYAIPVRFVSELEYNWQGFRRYGELMCFVDESGTLRNRYTGKLLRLAHFAGVPDIDGYLYSLPVEVTDALCEAIGEVDGGVLESLCLARQAERGVDRRSRMLLARAVGRAAAPLEGQVGAEQPLLGDWVSIASVAMSVGESDCDWNGLKCGSAYLSASEYQGLRDFLVTYGIESVIEFGAGYSTVLFARTVKRQIALEASDGPWLDFARGNGADARLAAFEDGLGFDEAELRQCAEVIAAGGGRGASLVFIDSPPRTANRRQVVQQVIKHFSTADFYAFHDSVRDASVVYELASRLGLCVVYHLPSLRGLTILGRPGQRLSATAYDVRPLKQRAVGMAFGVDLLERCNAGQGSAQRLRVQLTNVGSEVIPCASEALLLSFHVVGEDGEVTTWDMPRYTLAVDLAPRDQLSFLVECPAASPSAALVLFDFVKEGEFWWSRIAGVPCPGVSLA